MRAEGVGVPQLDKLLDPLPDHTALLFQNDPGVEAEPFLYQAAHHRLLGGGEVVYVVTNRAPASVLAAMNAYGLDIHEHRGRLAFVDVFSASMGLPSAADHVVHSPEKLADALDALGRERPGAWLLIDSLSSLVDAWGDEQLFLQAYPRLHAAIQRFALCEAIFTRWPYSGAVASVLDGFDAVVGIRGVVDRVTTGQYFVLERASWKPREAPRPRLFKALKPGGVHVYVPKIVVTGPYNAGKSSFIQAISDTAVSVDHLGTTVALDHGRVTLDGLTADIFGTPGQARFDPILRIVAGQAVGVVVVVDSTKPDSFPRAKEMLHQTWRQGLPGIIAANKQDLPDALLPEEVARLLDPPPRVKVVGCSGQDRDSGRAVLKELLDQILDAEVPT